MEITSSNNERIVSYIINDESNNNEKDSSRKNNSENNILKQIFAQLNTDFIDYEKENRDYFRSCSDMYNLSFLSSNSLNNNKSSQILLNMNFNSSAFSCHPHSAPLYNTPDLSSKSDSSSKANVGISSDLNEKSSILCFLSFFQCIYLDLKFLLELSQIAHTLCEISRCKFFSLILKQFSIFKTISKIITIDFCIINNNKSYKTIETLYKNYSQFYSFSFLFLEELKVLCIDILLSIISFNTTESINSLMEIEVFIFILFYLNVCK
jgi:hypothetical protein